jgi:hypothetical protein
MEVEMNESGCSLEICKWCGEPCFAGAVVSLDVYLSQIPKRDRDTIITDFSKAFDLFPQDRLLKKIAASVVDSRVVVWIGEFPIGRSQRARIGRQHSEEVRVTSGVLQGSVLGSLLFLVHVNDIWRNTESKIRLFADDCILYRKY